MQLSEMLSKLRVADPETYELYMHMFKYYNAKEDHEKDNSKAWLQFCIQRAISSKEGWSWALFGVDAKAVKALVSLSKDNNYKSNAESAAPALLSAYLAALEAQR